MIFRYLRTLPPVIEDEPDGYGANAIRPYNGIRVRLRVVEANSDNSYLDYLELLF